MIAISPGSRLRDALQGLQFAIRRLETEANPEPNQPRLKRLEAVIGSLDVPRVARPPIGLDEDIRQWKDYLAGRTQSLGPRSIRNLCWYPQAATHERFHSYLDRNTVSIGSRALQGLVWSCHTRWSREFAGGGVARKVRMRLEQYTGPNRLLLRWKPVSNMILGEDGAERFGEEMIREVRPIHSFCEQWGVQEQSPYVQDAVTQATEFCREKMDHVPLREYLLTQLLPWQQWLPDRFKAEVSKTVLHHSAKADAVRELVRRFILDDPRLGDPRLPQNKPHWIGIHDAERRVIEWLSRYDIVFFFEYVLPRSRDPHRRKDFWLRYVHRVTQSRPLLNQDDRIRLVRELKAKSKESMNFGRIDGPTSAFLLDFGNIVVVEFSVPGNACYVYSKADFNKWILADFWTRETLTVGRLKRKTVSLTSSADWDGVHRAGWETDAGQLLARYGVRI